MELLRTLRRMVARLFVGSGASLFLAPVQPEYPVENSMSTMARFPWIWACVCAIAQDQAGLPLVATRKLKGDDAETIEDPALDLIANPNAAMSGNLFRRQLWLDYKLCGNAYIWCPEGIGRSIAIYRLHPRSVRPIPGPMGLVSTYEWTEADTGAVRNLPAEQIIHIRNVSWQDSSVSVLGESVIRALHDDLTAEMNTKKTAALQAARGRPDILFSSKDPIGEQGEKKILSRWEEAGAKRQGAFFAGGEVTATPLSWGANESGEFERYAATRDAVLAVFGVPRIRLGLADENYATARQAEKSYWQGLKGEAVVFNDAFSRLAGPMVRIEHDYSSVEALQISYTERQARMQGWIDMGWSPEDAAAIEGFKNLPKRTGDPLSRRPQQPAPSGADDGSDDEPNEPADKSIRIAAATRAAIAVHLRCAEAAYADLDASVDTRLFVRWQTERLFVALHEAGHDAERARWWASEVCGSVDEAHRMGMSDAFAEQRAANLAERITHSLRSAA